MDFFIIQGVTERQLIRSNLTISQQSTVGKIAIFLFILKKSNFQTKTPFTTKRASKLKKKSKNPQTFNLQLINKNTHLAHFETCVF